LRDPRRHRVKDRHAADWEELARREPYFAVLTDERFIGSQGSDEFFASGEADVASLLASVASLVGREPKLERALDFGCGVGRLSIPLARRAAHVVGCDVAPTMLAHARENAVRAGVRNAEFATDLPEERFDFILSLLVLQHIPTSTGYALFAKLLDSLAPNGVAALHVTLRRPGGRLRRIARAIRARVPLVHRAMSLLRGDRRHLPYMQMNEYDERALQRIIDEADARLAGTIPMRHAEVSAAVLIIERARAK
jgi:SAM-dependent methyltransferase